MVVNQVAIVGAGPAGVATAIQLRRFGICPLLFERDKVGGLLRNANLVENYPGFPEGISGLELAMRIAHHLQAAAIHVIPAPVINLDFEGNYFRIETPGHQFNAYCVVVASGTKARKPASPVISPGVLPHIFYEVAQLSQEKGKKIAIIGAGDAAFDYALNLSRENEVVILNRGTAVKCIPLLWNRAQAVPVISYHSEVNITDILRPEHENPLDQVCLFSETGLKFLADFIIFAIGREPQLDFISEHIITHQEELIARGMLYFAGDVKNKIYRQTAISVGDGVLTAMKISRSTIGETRRQL